MPDKNDSSEIIAELLRSQDRTNERLERIENSMENMNANMGNMNASMENMRRENKENTDRMIIAFDRFATAVIDRLVTIETQLIKLADLDERLKRIEAKVFKK